MKFELKKLEFLILSLIILIIIGTLNYLFFNPDVLFVNYLEGIAGLNFKNYLIENSSNSSFLRNYFSDITFSAISLNIALILKNLKSNLFYIYFAISIPVLSEICQGFGLINGTFDYLDLLVYLPTGIFSIILLN